ncbi:unnamed protein product [Mortierella alpina]
MPATVDIHSPRLLRQHSNQSTPLIPQYPHLGAAFEFDNDFGPESSARVAALETSQAREFETAYCRDFYCCGLTLLDLHDLLQHCEECHVHFEEDDLDTDNEAEDDDQERVVRRRESDSSEDHGWSDSDSLPSSPSTASPPASDMGSMTSGSSGQHHHREAFAALRANSRLASKSTSSHSHASSVVSENHPQRSSHSFAFDNINSTTHALEAFSATFGASAKRKAVVAMSDIYSAGDEDGPHAHPAMRTNTSLQRSSTSAADYVGPMIKRHHATGAPSSITGTSWSEHQQKGQAYPPHPLSACSVGPYFGNIGHPAPPHYLGPAPAFLQGASATACAWPSSTSPVPITSLADLIRQRDEIFNIIDDLTRLPQNASGEKKPYRCAVPGCDKAYKNPNGLKYHNLHGHSSSSTSSSSSSSSSSSAAGTSASGDATGGTGDGEGVENKPYVCTFLECGKRYKNLNGLKYHIEHTHPNFMAALRAHQSGLINHPLLLQLAPLKEHHHDVMITLAAALAAVEASPVMAMAANAVLQSAAASAANHLNGHGHGHGHGHGPAAAAAVHPSVSFGSGNTGGSDPRSLKTLCPSETGPASSSASSSSSSSLPPVRGPHPESAVGPGLPTTCSNNSHPTVPIAPAALSSSNKK